jgi:uncharacterized protein (TIGR00106 family)
MAVIMEVSVAPLGTGSTSVSRYVARCLEVVREAGVTYQLTPMGTILEGELDELLSLVRRMHEVPFGEGAARVVTTLKIDDRRDKEASMAGKVRAVEEKLRG